MLIKLRKMMTRTEDQKGFTLVELIVVMAILAVLSALAVPRFSNMLTDSKFKAHNTNVESITRAIEMYNAQESNEFVDADLSALVPTYLKEVPPCPIAGVTDRVKADDKVAAGINYTFNTTTKKVEPVVFKLTGTEWAK